MVGGTSGWVFGMSSVAGYVSGGSCAEGSDTNVASNDGSGADGSVVGSGLGGGGGDGEWLGVIGVVGMWLGVGSSICGVEPSWMLENRSSISLLISPMFSSSSFLAGSLAGGGGAMSVGVKDEV